MTPRPDRDTQGEQRGLSCFDSAKTFAAGTKLRVIDSEKLLPPLGVNAHADGHVSIVPKLRDESIDDAELKAWADTRGNDPPHAFTQNVLDAVIHVLEKKEE